VCWAIVSSFCSGLSSLAKAILAIQLRMPWPRSRISGEENRPDAPADRSMGKEICWCCHHEYANFFQFQNKRARTRKTGGAMPPKRPANAPPPVDLTFDFMDEMPTYKNPAFSTLIQDGVEIVETPHISRGKDTYPDLDNGKKLKVSVIQSSYSHLTCY
jgi:hypothetical protein